MSISDFRLTRDGVCRTFKMAPETLAHLEEAGVLAPEADGLFDVAGVSAALFHFGTAQADAADRKLAAVAAELQNAMPALERLAGIAERAQLDGEARDRVLAEVSLFFNAFAGLMSRATAVLNGEVDD